MSAVIKMPENSAESLLLAAVEKGANVDTMERLMAMRRELRAEAARDAYYMALSKAQRDYPDIAKTKDVGGRYKYAPLDSIIRTVSGTLEDNGFSYSFNTERLSDGVRVTCTAHHRMGHSESSEIFIPEHGGHGTNDAQQTGSANTYGRRYSFCNVFGIQSEEDDDGKSAGAPQIEKVKRMMDVIRQPHMLRGIAIVKEGIAEGGDKGLAAEAYAEWTRPELSCMNVAQTKGGIWTTAENKFLRESKEFHDLVHAIRLDAGWYDNPENQA